MSFLLSKGEDYWDYAHAINLVGLTTNMYFYLIEYR